MAEICCRRCESQDCHGCNMYRLEQMLKAGDLDSLMNENRAIRLDVDVMPAVHGHWRGEYDGYADGCPIYDMWYCSECDYYIEDDSYPEYKYCPNCGARMDGDGE